jgi:ubiquinone/menaquinone biosynthesis C-methylase UbiE
MQRVLEPEVMDDEAEAAAYDAMDFWETDALFAETASQLAPSEPGRALRALDLGTGTAKIPVLLASARADVEVLAIDLADSMLALARRRVEGAGLAGRVTLAHMDAKSPSLEPGSFDLVMSSSLAHHLPDPTTLFVTIARLVRPGGAVLVRDLARPESPEAARALVSRVSPRDSAEQQRLFFESLCAALEPGEVRVMLDRAGLADVTVRMVTERHWSAERARSLP